jgi:S-formylglutathione hydrolase FrmB
MKKYLLLFLSNLLLVLWASASTVEVLSVPSEKMGRDIPVTLILPDGYAENEIPLPVVYLLHGAGGDHASWNDKSDVAQLADLYDVIVVCPDGGKTSWYFDSPIDPGYQYETFVAVECVNYIDANYRTDARREARALCGLSMGGHGSLYLAIRHQDTFSIAVPISGGVDIRPFPKNWEIARRIGTIESHPENWETHTVINLAKNLKPGDLAISLDCGSEDFFVQVNRNLHQQLLDQQIVHNYEEHPGKHTWKYWKEGIERQMKFIDQQFRKEGTAREPAI